MHSIPVLIKLVLLFLVTLVCLWLFLHLGGLWVTNRAQGYVVIYKKPPASLFCSIEIIAADAESLTIGHKQDHVRTVLSIRETNSFKDIMLLRYAALAVAVLGMLGLVGTLIKGRRKRYFKSRTVYDLNSLKF